MNAAPFSLQPDAIRVHVTAVTFTRGRDIYRSQQVLELQTQHIESDDWELSGLVQGSLRTPYSVTVQLELDDGGELAFFDSECSCPVGHLCKHAVALTLKAAYQSFKRPSSPSSATTPSPLASLKTLEAQKAEVERLLAQFTPQTPPKPPSQTHTRLGQWLDLFDDTSAIEPRAASATDNTEEHLVYLLIPIHKSGQDTLHLGYGMSRRLRTGKWAKVKVPRYLGPHDTTVADLQLTRLIGTLAPPSHYWGTLVHGPITGATGLLALQLAAQTGQLYAATADFVINAAVHLGPARPLGWQWKKVGKPHDPEPLWQLAFQKPPADANVQWFANSPPLYLDPETRLCGPLETAGVPAQHLGLLVQAPPVPQSAFTEGNRQAALLQRLAGLPLPPHITPPRVLQGLVPVVHLALAPVPAHARERLGLLSAGLHFDYGEVDFFSRDSRNPILVKCRANPNGSTEHVLLHRDLATEQTALDHLKELGLAGDAQGQFHLPTPTAPQQWLHWADEDFAALRQPGWVLSVDPQLHNWIRRADVLDVQMRPEGGDSDSDLVGGNDSTSPWFDLSLGMEINGERHNILPLLPALLLQLNPGKDSTTTLPDYVYLPQADGHYLRLPTAPLRPWLQALLDLVGDHGSLDGDSLRLSRLEALRVGAALGEGARWSGADSLRQMVHQLAGHSALPDVALPPGLQATLRPYQQHGLNWLQFLRSHSLAGILADDMGLGKTLQTLAHILVEKQAGRLDRPALIIAPVSLVGNWRSEAARFTPDLSTLVLHGADRHEIATEMARHDVVIAPYSLLQRDRERWLQQPWHLVVLDEAQNIKNANTHAAQVVAELNTRHRLCLSGTPMENHLGELWSLFHFLMPGFLGSQARFKELFRTPIEKHGDSERLQQLRSRITPFMLRRAKRDVATDLPAKQEVLTQVELPGKQADLYETIRLGTEKAVREALATKGLAKSQIQVLDALLKLRQVCCDPRLLSVPAAQKVKQSAKLELLMTMLPEMLAEGRRVLLFSQFTTMLGLIEDELKKRGIPWVKLTGQSQKRDALIERFTSGAVPLFLISLKAGGVGLNLPQADTVIHYDPWWNPAVENQATDRAHRIGQTQRVMVYKLVAQGTIEERILALQARKAALAESMYSGAQGRKQPLFTEDDVAELLRPLGS